MKKLLPNYYFFGLILFLIIQLNMNAQIPKAIFRNSKASIENRAKDLLSQLTLEEKISLLGFKSSAVPRLGIPAYNWWNEALHGVARAGKATVFPQAIGLASSFNNDL